MYKIHYTFYNRFNLDFDVIDRPQGSGDYLFLHFLTPMKIRLNNQTIITKENAFILFDKGTPQLYSAVKTFQNSFIHFDTDIPFAEKYNIPLNTILYFPDSETISNLLKNLHLEFFLKRPFFEETLDTYMTQLMIALSRSCNSDSAKPSKDSYLFNVFQGARVEILNHIVFPWTSESMAALTNLGTSQFYRYYQTFFGSTPKSDLLDARLSHAKELLTQKKITVTEAALQSGFQAPSHFTRFFKKKYHMAPQEWSHQNFPE